MVTFVLAAIVVTLFLIASGKYLMNYSFQQIKEKESVVTLTNSWK